MVLGVLPNIGLKIGPKNADPENVLRSDPALDLLHAVARLHWDLHQGPLLSAHHRLATEAQHREPRRGGGRGGLHGVPVKMLEDVGRG